ncbi:glycosyltransferase family 2 protein [Clostridioides difficile]
MKVNSILGSNSIWMPSNNYQNLNPIVSVILPTFSRAKNGFFEKAVQSVLEQKLTNIELIIIDDCSNDGTFDLIKYFMKADNRVSCIRHSYNIGLPAISEYEGYMRSRGSYIAFIFDDNEWQLDYLSKTVSFMERERVKASYGRFRLYYGEKKDEYKELGKSKHINSLIGNNSIANGGVVLHREVIESVGLYDPHISLTRLCDWDLWIRVSKKFRFEGTGILAGSEHGIKLNDSLGNTVKMNSWSSIEQMSKERNHNLLPSNFLSYDIFKADKNNSELFLDTIVEFSNQYKLKYWFDENDKTINYIRNIEKASKKIKKVIVLCTDFSATIALSFERIAESNSEVLFRFVTPTTFMKNELLYSDALICVRDHHILKSYIKICKHFDIPCYYYVDDNFKVLSESDKKNIDILELAKDTNYNVLKEYKGIFLSSNELVEYFRNNNLHENLMLLEPIIDEKNIQKFSLEDDEYINIAFMGGEFRHETLFKFVLPALEQLSNKRKINFYYPETIDRKKIKKFKSINLNLVEMKYSLSLNLTLFRYSEKNINILVHCGPDIENNLYKTENALINAVQIGAVLVSSETCIYRENNIREDKCFLSNNTENDWLYTLENIIENRELREKIYNNSLQYCLNRYNIDKYKKIVNDEIKKNKTISYINLIHRYEELYIDTWFRGNRFSNTYELKSRSLREVPLVLSKLISNSVSYNIKCNVENLTEIGICFASYGVCKGTVKISILEGKKQLREVILDLSSLVKDNWTYFKFDKIIDSLNKIYTINLKFCYERDSSHVGIFEDSNNRTFIYKLFNKLGHHINGMNAIFVDCRSFIE